MPFPSRIKSIFENVFKIKKKDLLKIYKNERKRMCDRERKRWVGR